MRTRRNSRNTQQQDQQTLALKLLCTIPAVI